MNSIPSFWYVGASTGGIPEQVNSGIRTTIEVRPQSGIKGVLSFWISEALKNDLWGQVGYYVGNGSKPLAFYQIWNLTDGSEIATGTGPLSQGFHSFTMIARPNGIWDFCTDSLLIGYFDMSANSSNPSYPMYAMSEEGYANLPFHFGDVVFSPAIQAFFEGGWHNVTSAVSYGNSWSIEGVRQIPDLHNDEILVGGSILGVKSSTSFGLW